MKSLEELGFSHEPAQRAGPTLAQHVYPLKVNLRQLDPRQRRRIPLPNVLQRLVHDQLRQLPAVGFDQPGPDTPELEMGSGGLGLDGEGSEGRSKMGNIRFVEGLRGKWGFGEHSGHGGHC